MTNLVPKNIVHIILEIDIGTEIYEGFFFIFWAFFMFLIASMTAFLPLLEVRRDERLCVEIVGLVGRCGLNQVINNVKLRFLNIF